MFRAGSTGRFVARGAVVGMVIAGFCGAGLLPAAAHSGGTDKYGCHAGSRPYHCHPGSDRSIEYPPTDVVDGTGGGGVTPATDPPVTAPPVDTRPPLVPRIVKWFIKGAILTIIFSGDDDSSIDIVSDVAGVVATFTGSSAEQTAEIELGPGAEEFTVVATDPAGNKAVSDPVYVEEEEPIDPSVDTDPNAGTPQAVRSEDDGSGPNLLLIGGLVAGAAAVGGGVEYARRRRAHRRVAAFDHDDEWAGSRKGGGPVEPPSDF